MSSGSNSPASAPRQIPCREQILQSNGVLHLGAHLGQEADDYASLEKPVLWVEAMPRIYERLVERLANFPKQKAFCALLGDKDGVPTTFNISNNSKGVSSSIYNFGSYGEGEKTLWPELSLRMVEQVTLSMVRLDTLFSLNSIDPNSFNHWVVDLQGAEKLALMGGDAALKHCKSLFIEVSTVEVYEGGVLWPELSTWLSSRGLFPAWQPTRSHGNVLFVRQPAQNQVG